MSEENKDYIKDFIKKNEEVKSDIETVSENNIEFIGDNVRQKVDYIATSLEEQFHNIDINILPYNKFYPVGTKLFIRAAKTKEIEAFSVVNEDNPFDRHTKIIQMLKECVRIQYLDGSYGNYTDIMYDDRDILLMLISRLTSKRGRKIIKKVKCSCGFENEIEFVPSNYIYSTENERLTKYFNTTHRRYDFKLKNNTTISLRPPTLGLIESLNSYILHHSMKAQQEGHEYIPNISFMTNITFLKSGLGVKELDVKKWEQEEYEYERMNDENFMFIADAIKLIDMNIKKVEMNCHNEICNKKVSTPFHYPDGVRALFIIPNAFDEFIL